MAYRFLGVLLIISTFVFGFSANASEDSGDPFSDEVNFDDLPDIASDDLEPLGSSTEEHKSSSTTSADLS